LKGFWSLGIKIKLALQLRPYVLDWIEIRRVAGWPYHEFDFGLVDELFDYLGRMHSGVVLLKYECILTVPYQSRELDT